MIENIFKTLLLTFNKSNNGAFEILYQSYNFLSWNKHRIRQLDNEEINALFPTLQGSLFQTIIEHFEKGKKLELPLAFDHQSFLWLKFEGCLLPQENNSVLVNTMISQYQSSIAYSWLINSKDQSILTEAKSNVNYFPSNLKELHSYLKDRIAHFPEISIEKLINENLELRFKSLTLKSRNLSPDYKLFELEEYQDRESLYFTDIKVSALNNKKDHEVIYFKYLRNSQEILWSGPLNDLLGYEDGNLRSFEFKNWLKLIHPDDQKSLEDFISKEQYENSESSFTYRVKNKKGHFQYLTNKVRNFHNPNTNEEGLTGTLINALHHQNEGRPLNGHDREAHNLSENNFIQKILTEISAISTFFKGKSLFEEINHLIFRKLGFCYCIIGNLNSNNNEMEILSICGLGEKLNDKDKKWQNFLNEILLPLDPNNNFLLVNHNETFETTSLLSELSLCSLLRLSLFDTEMNKIGVLCLLHDQPLKNKAYYDELFNILRDWISKELHRFRFENVLQETNFMHDAILNGTAYAIFAVNHQFELILINNKTLPVFNVKSKEELMNTKLIKGNVQATLLEVISDFLKTNSKTAYYHLPISKDNYKELKISFTKIQYGNDNKESYVLFVDDITDRTLSEKKLIESEQLFRSIAENFPHGSVDVLDKSFNYLFTDGEEYQLSGTDPKSLIGTNLLSKLTGENLQITRLSLKKVLKGQRVSYETESNQKKFLQSGVPLMNNSKEVDRILLVKQNISEAKKLESDKEKLIKDLKSHNEELLRFAYIVSHNLRAPIVNIALLIDLYNEDNPADPGNKEVWENLKISTNLLDTTLQDLIEVVSIKKQKIPKVEQIDFKLLLNNVEKSLFNQLKESGIKIIKDFSKLDEINYVYAHLESFFMNFMTNSVKYKHPDRSPVVKINTYKEKNYCVIRFEDNGIGLDLSRYGDRIFGLYQRFHNHVEGKGLGLYLIREQIRAHDGKIEIESEVGKGTVFKVYLRNLIIHPSQN